MVISRTSPVSMWAETGPGNVQHKGDQHKGSLLMMLEEQNGSKTCNPGE